MCIRDSLLVLVTCVVCKQQQRIHMDMLWKRRGSNRCLHCSTCKTHQTFAHWWCDNTACMTLKEWMKLNVYEGRTFFSLKERPPTATSALFKTSHEANTLIKDNVHIVCSKCTRQKHIHMDLLWKRDADNLRYIYCSRCKQQFSLGQWWCHKNPGSPTLKTWVLQHFYMNQNVFQLKVRPPVATAALFQSTHTENTEMADTHIHE